MRNVQRAAGLVSLAVFAIGGLTLQAQRSRNTSQPYATLSGTYELESTRGGNPKGAAEIATRSLPPGQRERAYKNLVERLQAPQRLSIDRNGQTITLASSSGPRSIFEADGRVQTERGPNGRMGSTRADLTRTRLTVSTSGGSRGSDFLVTFDSQNNGANLLVTRRLDDDDLARPVSMQSYYHRIYDEPRWDVYGPGPDYGRENGMPYPRSGGAMFVPDGTRLVATLDTSMSMRTSRHGEAFTMTVRGGEFEGARINGVIARVGGDRGGNGMDMRVDFQTIEYRGRTSEFDAVLNTVRQSDGSILRVNADGDVRQSNRGETTVRNGAIGGAIGAIIGAIAGGGKGAAIGAGVGIAGGVILSQGHEQLDLRPGSDVTLTAFGHYRTP